MKYLSEDIYCRSLTFVLKVAPNRLPQLPGNLILVL